MYISLPRDSIYPYLIKYLSRKMLKYINQASELEIIGKIRKRGRDIFFPNFIRKDIETRKLERKSIKTTNISFKQLIISFKDIISR